jgi:hypothetical protein
MAEIETTMSANQQFAAQTMAEHEIAIPQPEDRVAGEKLRGQLLPYFSAWNGVVLIKDGQ